jgi:predicted Zn-dependent peptidase
MATFVVVGDVTEERITSLLGKVFAGWKTPTTLPVPPSVEPYLVRPKGMRTFVVDRADVPQIVMSLAGAGPRAGDASYARLNMLNIALGGSFTSRLNQNLREDHGWTYGARSRFNAQRGPGMFVVRAAIKAAAISAALHETRNEVDRIAKGGITDAEVDKLRALVNGEALEVYGTVHGASGSLSRNALLGLLPDQDAKDLASERSATVPELAALAAKNFDLSSALVVLVGPKDLAVKALAENGLPSPDLVDANGKPAGPRLSAVP